MLQAGLFIIFSLLLYYFLDLEIGLHIVSWQHIICSGHTGYFMREQWRVQPRWILVSGLPNQEDISKNLNSAHWHKAHKINPIYSFTIKTNMIGPLVPIIVIEHTDFLGSWTPWTSLDTYIPSVQTQWLNETSLPRSKHTPYCIKNSTIKCMFRSGKWSPTQILYAYITFRSTPMGCMRRAKSIQTESQGILCVSWIPWETITSSINGKWKEVKKDAYKTMSSSII